MINHGHVMAPAGTGLLHQQAGHPDGRLLVGAIDDLELGDPGIPRPCRKVAKKDDYVD